MSTDEAKTRYENLLDCIHDVYEGLVPAHWIYVSQETFVEELGDHWADHSLDDLISEGYVESKVSGINLSVKGEQKLILEAGVAPKPTAVELNASLPLIDRIKELAASDKVRAVATSSDVRGYKEDAVRLESTTPGLPQEQDLLPVAEAVEKILQTGGFDVALTPAGETPEYQKPTVYVLKRPHKKPVRDVTAKKCLNILMGRPV